MVDTSRKGLPRTAKAADKRNLQKLGFNFVSMSEVEAEKFNLVHVDKTRARPGALGIIGTLPPKIVPGTTPGTHLVCYYEASTGDYTDCRIVHDT